MKSNHDATSVRVAVDAMTALHSLQFESIRLQCADEPPRLETTGLWPF